MYGLVSGGLYGQATRLMSPSVSVVDLQVLVSESQWRIIWTHQESGDPLVNEWQDLLQVGKSNFQTRKRLLCKYAVFGGNRLLRLSTVSKILDGTDQ